MTEIRFGTDGWRAVVADDFTFENLRLVAQATAEWMKREHLASQGVVIGYDTRFLAGLFAGAVAEVMAANEIPVTLSSTFMPTPALAWQVVQSEAGAGVMITASHNPARWNGFKIKTSRGGPASTEVTGSDREPDPCHRRGGPRRAHAPGRGGGGRAWWSALMCATPT
jgi:phosphomannomutase